MKLICWSLLASAVMSREDTLLTASSATTTTTTTATVASETTTSSTDTPLSKVTAKQVIPSAACASYATPLESVDKYHGDHVCDVNEYNTFKHKMKRHETYQALKQSIHLVPNEATVVCPLEVQDLHHATQTLDGFDVVWIVENTSSQPIVVSHVNRQTRVETSAMNAAITPPHADPNAILQPGQWKDIRTYEGHVFHVRTLDTSTGQLGPVVLQHQAGLRGVGAKFQDLECPKEAPQPVHPATDRPPAPQTRACNTLDIGFRNLANCPLHGYFLQEPPPSNNTTTAEDATQCQEQFKFHLGMNQHATDFFYQWDSNTKFEGSYVGHTFVFRSAANLNIVVDRITMQPTRIIDCPTLDGKSQVNRVSTVSNWEHIEAPILLPDDHLVTNGTSFNVTAAMASRRITGSANVHSMVGLWSM